MYAWLLSNQSQNTIPHPSPHHYHTLITSSLSSAEQEEKGQYFFCTRLLIPSTRWCVVHRHTRAFTHYSGCSQYLSTFIHVCVIIWPIVLCKWLSYHYYGTTTIIAGLSLPHNVTSSPDTLSTATRENSFHTANHGTFTSHNSPTHPTRQTDRE